MPDSKYFTQEAAFIRSGKRPGFGSLYRNFRLSKDERARIHGHGGIWEQERIIKPMLDLKRIRSGKMSYEQAAKKYKGRIIDQSVRRQFVRAWQDQMQKGKG